jgi:uncharacterized protein
VVLLRPLALLLMLGTGLLAHAQVPVPQLSARVMDQTGTLTADQAQALEQTLRVFESSKGSQIAVLVVPTTEPETIEQYGIRVAEQWKLGRKGVDDGVILIVAKNDRTLRIEVGYGLEGALNDATCKRIISEIIVPRFRQGDFFGGITDGVNRMIRVIQGEPLPEPSASPALDAKDLRQFAPLVLVLALVVGAVLRSVLGKLPGAVVTGGVLGYLAWLVAGTLFIAIAAGFVAFLFTLLGGGMIGPVMSGMASGRRGGGGFGASGSGGAFRGGGGGFGGGGASGRW